MKIIAAIKNDELGLAYLIGNNVHDIKSSERLQNCHFY